MKAEVRRLLSQRPYRSRPGAPGKGVTRQPVPACSSVASSIDDGIAAAVHAIGVPPSAEQR